MRKKETPNPSRMRGRGVEVLETLFYLENIVTNLLLLIVLKESGSVFERHCFHKYSSRSDRDP